MQPKKPKILIYANHLLPYSETFIKSHAIYLKQFNGILLGQKLLVDGLNIADVKKCVINDGFLGEVDSLLSKLGIITPRLKRKLLKTSPVLLHAHFGPNGYIALPFSNFLKVPLITTFHGYDITIEDISISKNGVTHYLFNKNLERLKANGNAFIAVSKFIERKLIEKGFPQNKIFQNYLGIDCNFFSADQANIRKKTILCIGRLVAYKGQKYLIEAMQLVQKQHPDYELVFLGDGPEMPTLKQHSSKLGVNVSFKGRLSPDEVKEHLNEAMVYCQPSIKRNDGQEEALALTIVEAQAMGVPAIVFNSGGMPEAINPNKSGYVVENKNVQQLAEKIMYLIEDKPKWVEFSANAEQYAREKHCIKKQTQKLEGFYKKLLNEVSE